ncbi:Protein of unknown function [Lactobacillus helveticus CIRM-BIA 101]|jgi:hypothetical protein
MKQG